MSTVTQLPHWDMTVVFPGLDSPEFDAAFRHVVTAIADIGEFFETSGIERQENSAVDGDTVRTFETAIPRLNDLMNESSTLFVYIHCHVATDSRNAVAQAKRSELQQHFVRISQLGTRFTAWIGSLDVDALLAASAVARDNEYMLRRAKIDAEHLMSSDLEDLSAELQPVAGSAWARLHADITSQMMVPVQRDGATEEVPMTVVRNMAYDPDRDVRRRGYEAELAVWERNALPIAAALNGVKGESNLLNDRRGWESPIDVACHGNNIDRETLDAMMSAAHDSFPDFRRYFRAKARALGIERCTWYDLFAPVGQSTSDWEYDAAVDFLIGQFRSYSDRMADFAARAFRENWIDAEPRPGKVGGAFCIRLRGDESRVLANYVPQYEGMSTLAHELGHAYHNFNLAGRTPLQRGTPMTLAETASIFCETIVQSAALERADPGEQLVILESSIGGACQVVVDITSRFLFEKGVFERRKQRELSIAELNDLMLETQRETYGDGLDESVLHPYMWAVKGHYYGRTFYNFPYMFGLLFGLGLYARYQQDPDGFRRGYDELLSSTGMTDPATLASRFGIDIRSKEFWTSSLDIVRSDIERFERLVDRA